VRYFIAGRGNSRIAPADWLTRRTALPISLSGLSIGSTHQVGRSSYPKNTFFVAADAFRVSSDQFNELRSMNHLTLRPA
jgi:hypothetical protein